MKTSSGKNILFNRYIEIEADKGKGGRYRDLKLSVELYRSKMKLKARQEIKRAKLLEEQKLTDSIPGVTPLEVQV